MAIKFFEEEESVGNGSLEFVGDYLESNPKKDKAVFEVVEISKAKSGKGYLIKTDAFICFVWNNSKIKKQLIEALDYYVKQGKGWALIVQLDKRAKEKYHLGLDNEKPVIWYEAQGKYSTYQDGQVQSKENISGNPFLIPVP